MKLTNGQIADLAKLLGITHEKEADCDECLQHVAEYAERVLTDRSLTDTMRTVEQHLLLCVECRAEYRALSTALVKMHASSPKS